MLASRLVHSLSMDIDSHGDHEVVVYIDGQEFNVDGSEFNDDETPIILISASQEDE